MRLHTGQQQQQQLLHQQTFCAADSCLKQQQHFTKGHQSLQVQGATHLHQQQKYHQHHVLQQQQPPPALPSHMWNPQLNAACYPFQPHNSNTVNSSGNPSNINLQSCRPFITNRVYQHPTHYPSTNGFPQSSERSPLTTPNYAKLPPLSVVNQQRINECAGIPLISTATAHLAPGQRQRVSRKQSHSPPGKHWPNMLPGNVTQNYTAVAHYTATHVQGAPLMFNKQQQQKLEYWSPNIYAASKNQTNQQEYATKVGYYNNNKQERTRTPLHYQNSAPPSLSSSRFKEPTMEQQIKHSKDSENSSSNNGDSSNSNETCLPRIIKPRKRRKKDRKPPSSLVNAVYLQMDNKTFNDKTSNNHVNAIKSYKSSEDLLECWQKLTQLTNLNEKTQQTLIHCNKTEPFFDLRSQNKKEPTENLSSCTNGSSINNHGICFCNECDPLRSIWDYPLRRSLSDSSSSESSGTGSLSDTYTSPSIDECLTKTLFNWPKARAEIVGVIGSKRNKDQQTSTTYNLNNMSNNNINNNNEITQDNQFFHNDILSGINLASDLFKEPNSTAFSDLNSALTAPDNMFLLPETAETLLTKSINEISKKLIETCSNESYELPLSVCNSLQSFETTSSNSSSANSTCTDFSNDSGIESAHINTGDDLVFNFDNLHITTTTKSSMSPSSDSLSSSTSSFGNLSMSSCSPTVKFTSNFLTQTQTQTSTFNTATAASASASNPASVTNLTMQQTTPLTPSKVTMSTTINSAPTSDFLIDLKTNHLHVATAGAMIVTENQKQLQQDKQKQKQKQQFNDLLRNHQPLQQQQLETHQHDQQFFHNYFDLLWQQHEKRLGNKNIISTSTITTTTTTTTATSASISTTTINSNHIDQLTSSALTSNNVAMSSFLNSVGSLKSVFSTIS